LPPAAFGGPALEGEVDSGFVYEGFGTGAETDGPSPDDPAARLRRLIEKRQTESIEILRGWMEHEEERA